MNTYMHLMAETGFGTMLTFCLLIATVFGGIYILSEKDNNGEDH